MIFPGSLRSAPPNLVLEELTQELDEL